MFKQLITLSKTDFKSRYAGHTMGALWALAYPAATVLLYFIVFKIILKTGPIDGSPYLLWLVSALAPYLFISEAVSAAASSFPDYAYIAKKSRLSLGLLPAARVLSCLAVHGVFLAALAVIKHSPALSDLLLAACVAAELAFALAAGYLLALLTVFFRDIKSLLPILTQIGFWLTPIFWDASAAPEPFRTLLRAVNPCGCMAECFRSVLCGGGVPLWYIVYFSVITIIIGVISTWLFRCIKHRIIDFF